MTFIPQRTRKWLEHLPAGEYTLSQVQSLTGKDKSNVAKLFKRLGVERKVGKLISANLVEIIYIWEGLP